MADNKTKRSILFRAKSNIDGEWYYGQLGNVGQNGPVALIRQPGNVPFYNVDLTTLTQYTDIKDKNGREIYEGDIIKHPEYGELKVQYLDGAFTVYRVLESIPFALIGTGLFWDQVEVVGTMFDNCANCSWSFDEK